MNDTETQTPSAPEAGSEAWEYHWTKDTNHIHNSVLDRLGEAGWEMCGCHVTRETEVVAYFKRRIKRTPNTKASDGANHP